jgi:phage-related protein
MIFLPGVRKELLKLPQQVRDDIGEAVWIAQNGMKAESAKPLTGSEFKGGKVMEIVSNFDKDTYRGVYTIEFEEAIYLVDAFENGLSVWTQCLPQPARGHCGCKPEACLSTIQHPCRVGHRLGPIPSVPIATVAV